MSCGKIELFLGPMFAGKSSELLRRVKRARHARKNVVLVKHARDNRYKNDRVVTHNGLQSQPCVSVQHLKDIDPDTLKDADLIALDEGQFWHDLAPFCLRWAQNGATVMVAALDGDYTRTIFASIAKLLPLADKVQKLRAICFTCGKKAAFTHFKKDPKAMKDKNVFVGGDQVYEALCRLCYKRAVRMQRLRI